MIVARLGVVIVLACALAGCAQKQPAGPDRLALSPVGFTQLAGWDQDRVSEAVPALARSCAILLRQADDKPVGPDGLAGTVAEWRAPCAALAALPAGDDTAARRFFATWFGPFAMAGRDGEEGLFTGYYEPELAGSRQRSNRFSVPLYGRPDDLITVDLGAFRGDWKGQRIAGRVVGSTLKPYPDRAEIDRGALAGKGTELLYVDDPIAAFFMEIQGSGRVTLAEGGMVRLGYAAQNGHPYVPIGRTLIEDGSLTREQADAPGIRAWLAAHPDRARMVMARNPSYVFFREIQGEGPIGAQNAVLTPGRSLAVDPAFLALGSPIWLDVSGPEETGGTIRRLVIAQDTGGAIKGPVRGDVFWGAGAAAERQAGIQRQRGRAFLLLPKSVAARRALVG